MHNRRCFISCFWACWLFFVSRMPKNLYWSIKELWCLPQLHSKSKKSYPSVNECDTAAPNNLENQGAKNDYFNWWGCWNRSNWSILNSNKLRVQNRVVDIFLSHILASSSSSFVGNVVSMLYVAVRSNYHKLYLSPIHLSRACCGCLMWMTKLNPKNSFKNVMSSSREQVTKFLGELIKFFILGFQ